MRARLRRLLASVKPAAPVVPLGCSTPHDPDASHAATARALLADPDVAADFAIGVYPDASPEVIEAMERLSDD